MERENWSKRLLETGSTIAALSGIAWVLFSAFSYEVKHEIHRRDGYRCKRCGVSHNLEAAHKNHDKREVVIYNSADNGETLCTRDHYIQHQENEGHNGLTRAQNRWALERIWERLSDSEREGLQPPY